MKKFLITCAIGMLAFVGVADAQQGAAASSAFMKPAKPFRVVDLKRGSFVIDTPGNWVLNRSWTIDYVLDVPLNVIDVVADNVVLDFRGFEIEVGGTPDVARVTVINVQGQAFTLKNGHVTICCGEQGSALRSTGFGTQIEGFRGYSFDAMVLEGAGSVIRDSSFHARNGVRLSSSRGLIERSSISCNIACVNLIGDENKLLNSHIEPGQFLGLLIGGSGNVVAGNVMDFPDSGPELQKAFDVRGNTNVVRDNTLAAGGETFVVLNVSGTANVIDGNIAAVVGVLPGAQGPIFTGIRFEQNGNFYGDNRMDATVPFDLGATTQTDWGGNVGY